MTDATRDRDLERELLALTSPVFADHVAERLDRCGGDTLPTHRTVAELVAEIREECHDIGGWAAMALQVAAGRLTPAQLDQLRNDLAAAVVLANHADEILTVTLDFVQQYGPGVKSTDQ